MTRNRLPGFGAVGEADRVVGIARQRLVEGGDGGDGGVEFAHLLGDATAIAIEDRVVRLEPDRHAEIGERLVVAALATKDDAAAVERYGERRIGRDRGIEIGKRVLETIGARGVAPALPQDRREIARRGRALRDGGAAFGDAIRT